MLDNQRFFASLMKRYYAYNNKSGTTVSDGFVSSCCDIEKLIVVSIAISKSVSSLMRKRL